MFDIIETEIINHDADAKNIEVIVQSNGIIRTLKGRAIAKLIKNEYYEELI